VNVNRSFDYDHETPLARVWRLLRSLPRRAHDRFDYLVWRLFTKKACPVQTLSVHDAERFGLIGRTVATPDPLFPDDAQARRRRTVCADAGSAPGTPLKPGDYVTPGMRPWFPVDPPKKVAPNS
jgi:hypothetical protein